MNRQSARSLRTALGSSALAFLGLLVSGCEALDQASDTLDSTSQSLRKTTQNLNAIKADSEAALEHTKGSVEEAGASIEDTVDGAAQDAEQATQVPEVELPEIDLD